MGAKKERKKANGPRWKLDMYRKFLNFKRIRKIKWLKSKYVEQY